MSRQKHSLVDSPRCPNCGGEIRWYRSELVKFEPITTQHLFNCLTCSFVCAVSGDSEAVHPGELGVTPFMSATPLGQRIHHAIQCRVRAFLDLDSVLRPARLIRPIAVLGNQTLHPHASSKQIRTDLATFERIDENTLWAAR